MFQKPVSDVLVGVQHGTVFQRTVSDVGVQHITAFQKPVSDVGVQHNRVF